MLVRVGHYRIQEKLSAGGTAEVFLARDEHLDRDVVLKFLHERLAADSRASARFVREARAASALNHPNIITIYDAGDSEAGRFIVMEFVRGQTLRQFGTNQIPLELLIRIATQITKALVAAHAAGIVHRDIKPENIMVRDDGYVKVLDFGLARWEMKGPNATPQTETAPGTLLGTLRYMSPEQASGRATLTASDIFSFGVVLYELSAGRYPFDISTEVGILRAISSQVVIPPSRLKPQFPGNLEKLILWMLQKDPSRRPTATQVEEALEAMTGHPSGMRSSFMVRTRRRVVGRQNEISELRAAFESAMKVSGLLVAIGGEPGIGKTTLVEDFLDELTNEDCVVGRGRSSERLEGAEAYLPLLEALEELLESDLSGSMHQLMKQEAPNWFVQVTPAASDETGAGLATPLKSASRERLKRELASFLQQASIPRPVILFFDDLQWADESTVDLLAYVATWFDTMRVLVVATFRPEELALNKHRFGQVKLDLQAHGRCREIQLGFLTRGDIAAYLSLEFPQHDFPRAFAELIHAKTEGSPFFMVDVLRYLRDQRVIAERAGKWSLSGTVPDIERDLPQSIRGMIQRKIELLTESDRKLLVAASVQGYEFDSMVIAKALPMDPVDVEEHLESLDRVHGFIRLIREHEFPDRTLSLRYRFVHVLYHNALYASLRPARKTSWSLAVAQTLLGFYGDHAAELASQLGVLFESARDFPQAAKYFDIAAQHAATVFAYNEAVLLARRGLESLEAVPEGSDRAQLELTLQLHLGLSLLATKGYGNPEVQQIYNRARQLCVEMSESPRLFPALWGLEAFYAARLELSTARDIGDQLLRLAQQSQDPELLLGAHLGAGAVRYFSGELESALEHFRHHRHLDNPERRMVTTRRYGLEPGILLIGFEARVLWFLGYPDQCLTGVYESLRMARSFAHPPTLAFVIAFVALAHQMRGEVSPTQAMADELIDLGTQHGLRLWIAEGSFFSAWARTEQSKPEDGIGLMRHSLEEYCATGTEMLNPYFRAVLAESLGKAGKYDEGKEVLIGVLNFPYPIYYTAELYRVYGDLLLGGSASAPQHLKEAAIQEAESHLLNALRIAREQRAKSFELRAAMSLSNLWLAQGRVSEAQEVMREPYDWFVEGFETSDLKEAKIRLDSFSTKVQGQA